MYHTHKTTNSYKILFIPFIVSGVNILGYSSASLTHRPILLSMSRFFYILANKKILFSLQVNAADITNTFHKYKTAIQILYI